MKLTIKLTLICFLVSWAGYSYTAQTDQPVEPPEPKAPDPSVQVEKVEIGPEGLVIKDRKGKILKIEHPHELDLEEIDSILEAAGKTKIEIERLKTDLELFPDSLVVRHGTGSMTIELGEHERGDVVKFGQMVHIGEKDIIHGDVVSIGGPITVDGRVTGSAVAVGGRIIIGNTALIEEDAVAVGGSVIKHPGGIIKGDEVSLSFVPIPGFAFHHGFYRGAQLVSVIVLLLVFMFLGMVGYVLAPKNVNKVREKIQQNFVKSVLVGVLGQFLAFLAFLLLLVTVIGIPIAVLLLPLFLFVAFVLGIAGTSYHLGEKIKDALGLGVSTPIVTILVGTTAIFSLVIIWAVIDFGVFWAPFMSGLNLLLLLLALAVLYLFGSAGFGAALITKLGTRPKDIPSQPPAQTTPPAPAAA
jgi:hypothetical protein